jgi:hypothetical protein
MPFYGDISSPVDDVIGDDYTTKVTTKMKTKAGPCTVTSETERVSKDGVSLLSKLSLKYAGPNGFSLDKFQMKPKGEAVVETSLTDKDRGLKYTFKGDISKKGDLGVEYTKGMLGLTATMDLFEQKKFSTTALVSQNAFAVGGSANLKTSGGVTLDTFSVGASYSTGPFFAALTTTKLSSATLAVKYEVSDTLKVVTSSEHSASSPLGGVTVGCVYDAKSNGVIKAKCTSGGEVSAVLVKEIAKKVNISPSVTVSNGDVANAKYGIGVVMG